MSMIGSRLMYLIKSTSHLILSSQRLTIRHALLRTVLRARQKPRRHWRSLDAAHRPRAAHSWAVSLHGSRSEEHTSELQSPCNLVCRLLLEKKKDGPKQGPRCLLYASTPLPKPRPPI